MFSDVRASLKHAGTPTEKPINPTAYGSTSLRKGQPTINLGADKMAAFLIEMKTHRLRKVGGIQDHGPTPSSSRSQPAKRVREIGDAGNRSEILPRGRVHTDIGNRSESILSSLQLERTAKRKHAEAEQQTMRELSVH